MANIDPEPVPAKGTVEILPGLFITWNFEYEQKISREWLVLPNGRLIMPYAGIY